MANLSSLVAPYEKIPATVITNGVVLDCVTPQEANGSVSIVSSGGVRVKVGTVGGSSGWNQSADGYANHTGAYQPYLQSVDGSVPSITTAGRAYEIKGKFDAYPSTNEGIQIAFNYVDGSNYWLFRSAYNGSTWITELFEYNTAVWYARDSYTSWGALAFPLHFHHVIYDCGDYVRVVSSMFDINGGPQADDTLYYFAASRPFKSSTNYFFQTTASCPELKIRSVRIYDI